MSTGILILNLIIQKITHIPNNMIYQKVVRTYARKSGTREG
ncbi:hypothetical protein [Salinispira pacifica]|uniref:Uncharacterized protein n=1 Tax=Salinispira pacifica TaxID=1307761 RepID=V5WLE8_9SPIO|nr:hypothetical protein [Salinispira pacifica]AHC16697.1 hypothetical protein L21SP2_3359 [Salinispira pacifica]